MLLNIREMEVHDLPFDQSWQPGELDFSEYSVTQRGPLRARGVAQLFPDTGGEVRVRGHASADLEAACDRCLLPAPFHVETDFDLFYKPADSESGEEEKALDEGEAEMGFYEMPGLILDDIVQEQILLQLPMQRLCKPDCRGICPLCGANRNETECRCEARPPDDRWSGLKAIHVGGRH